MSFIEVSNLNKYFGSHHALRDINFAIGEGEFATFLGPSGCGKTTTLRLIAGFLRPDEGEVRVKGEILSSPRLSIPPENRRMGMVFQNYAIWPHMSVFENVAFGLSFLRLDKRSIRSRVETVLETVGLSGLGGRHPGQLSGGQQQRVALARSLVVEPSILLLDEPLSNLDAKLRDHMRGELKALQRRTGITFIYVTHDQTEALSLSDQIVMFQKGAVQQVGTPREIYDRPSNLFVADFMGALNKLDGIVTGKNGDRLMVAIGEVRFEAVSDSALPLNTKTTLAIRPEAIRLDVAGGGVNTFGAEVTDVTFLGSSVEYALDIQGISLKAQGSPIRSHAPGHQMNLTIPPEACVAMAVA